MNNTCVFSKEYKVLKSLLVNLYNGTSVKEIDLEKLEEHIQSLYDEDKLKASQYDELISILQDIE